MNVALRSSHATFVTVLDADLVLQGTTVIGLTVTKQYALTVFRVETRGENAIVAVLSSAPLTAVIIYKSPVKSKVKTLAWIVH